MIQTRAQFGFYGAVIALLVVFFLSFGYLASTQALSGITLAGLAPGLPVELTIVIVSVPVLALAILGHHWIHRWQRIAAILLGLCIAYLTINTLRTTGINFPNVAAAAPPIGVLLGAIAIFVVYQLTWAPYVADYSRYLPADSSATRTFAATFTGQAISAMWLQLLAAYIVTMNSQGTDVLGALVGQSGDWVLLVMALSLIGSAATMLYSGMLSLVTIGDTFGLRRTGAVRIGGIIATLVVGLPIALIGYGSFLDNFTSFLQVCLFLLIPWSSVNLVDYYFVKRGEYDVRAFFSPAGVYGRWQWRGLLAYLAGLAVEALFINQAMYVGPAAKALGTADISWLVGLVVPALIYLPLANRTRPMSSQAKDQLDRGEEKVVSLDTARSADS